MYVRSLALAACLFLSVAIFGQQVSTFLEQPGTTFEAITWASNGAIYTVDFSNGKVYRLDKNANIRQIGDYGSVLGGAVDADNNFYCSEFLAGQIIKFDPNDNATIYANGLSGPAGIVIDSVNQIMYVSNYSGNRISKIDMSIENPIPETLVEGQGLNGPDGLVFSPEGDLISANFDDNKLNRVKPDGAIEPFTQLPSQNSGYIIRRGNHYIITGANTPQIFQITLDGEVSLLTGQGMAGTTNGTLSEAKFNLPNGIARSPSGDSLLIAQSASTGQIRLITGLGMLTQVEEIAYLQQLKVYPNPTTDYLNVNFTMPNTDSLLIRLLNADGKQLAILLNSNSESGQVREQLELPNNLIAGIYLVHFTIGQLQWSVKVELNTQ